MGITKVTIVSKGTVITWDQIEQIHKRLEEIDSILDSFKKVGVDIEQIKKELEKEKE